MVHIPNFGPQIVQAAGGVSQGIAQAQAQDINRFNLQQRQAQAPLQLQGLDLQNQATQTNIDTTQRKQVVIDLQRRLAFSKSLRGPERKAFLRGQVEPLMQQVLGGGLDVGFDQDTDETLDIETDQLQAAITGAVAQETLTPEQIAGLGAAPGSVIQRAPGTGALTSIQKGQFADPNAAAAQQQRETAARLKAEGVARDITQRELENLNKLITDAKKDKRVDNFIQVSSSFDRVKSASPTAAGDLSIVFSFMKMLDPGSVVREGEQALARNAAGVPDRIRTTYNNILAGETLAPEQRKQFVNEAKKVFDASRANAENVVKTFEKRAKKQGLDPTVIRESIFSTPAQQLPEGIPQGSVPVGTNAQGEQMFRTPEGQVLVVTNGS